MGWGGPTLGLHARPDQGQRVAGQLSTGAGGGSTGQQHKHTRISAVLGKVLQPVVLQGLEETGGLRGGQQGALQQEGGARTS